MNPAKLNPTIPEDGQGSELEVHPLVALVVARMESHPHDFYRYDRSRGPTTTHGNTSKLASHVAQTLEHTKALWNREEKRIYNIALRNVRMAEAHERLMAILLSDK